MDSLHLDTTVSVWALSFCGASSLMGVTGGLSSALALNGVTWTVSSQSKSKVSLNPSEVFSLFPWVVGAVLARVADWSRLFERALGLGFSHGFFNGPRSGLRPRSCFLAGGSGLFRGCCWACFLPGRCWLARLGGVGSGVECWNSSVSMLSANSAPAPCTGWIGSLLSPLTGLAGMAPRPPIESSSLIKPLSCTRSDLLRLLLSVWRRLTPTVDGRETSSSGLDGAFCSGDWGSTEKMRRET